METKRKGTVLENLAGQKFNRYTVIELDKEKSNNKFWKIFWRCRCDCGSEKSVSSQALKSGTTKSCGCLHRERAKDRCGKLFKKRVLQHPRIAILQQYKYRAKRFNRLFAIPEDVFFNLIEQKCYYCGSEPIMKQKQDRLNIMSQKFICIMVLTGLTQAVDMKRIMLSLVV